MLDLFFDRYWDRLPKAGGAPACAVNAGVAIISTELLGYEQASPALERGS